MPLYNPQITVKDALSKLHNENINNPLFYCNKNKCMEQAAA